MLLNASLLGALRCFEVAARHCNFTHAAAELNLTPGAVSHQIRQLEQRLGRTLFKRLSRGLALTDEAQVLLQSVSQAFRQLDIALDRLAAEKSPLNVSCTPTFAMMWLMPRLNRFNVQYPEIQIRLIAEFQQVDQANMVANDIDVAIRYVPRENGDRQLELMGEYLLPVAASEYLSDKNLVPDPSPEQAVTLLHDAWPWDGAMRDVEWRTWLEGNGYHKGEGYIEQDYSLFMLAYSAAQNQQGLCMGRIAMIMEKLQRGSLHRAADSVVRSPAHYCLLVADSSDARVATLSEWLQEECAIFSQACTKYIQKEGLLLI